MKCAYWIEHCCGHTECGAFGGDCRLECSSDGKYECADFVPDNGKCPHCSGGGCQVCQHAGLSGWAERKAELRKQRLHSHLEYCSCGKFQDGINWCPVCYDVARLLERIADLESLVIEDMSHSPGFQDRKEKGLKL